MKEFMVQLTSISDIKGFVNIASDQVFDISILSGRHVVDAKSIMAVFSIELSKPLRVEVHSDHKDCEAFRRAVEEFIVPDMDAHIT